MRRFSLVCSVALLATSVSLLASQVSAASWSSFLPASFAGVQVSPALVGGTTHYELSMSANPQIIIGGNTYDINWIQAYYVVGETPSTVFTAGEGTTSQGWSWEAKTAGGQIAGWTGTGGDRLYPGESMTFDFSEFEAAEGSVLSGIHVAYQEAGVNCCEVTDWRKADLTVPEPSSLVVLVGGVIGSFSLLRRRKAR